MARAKVVHSDDAVEVVFRGTRADPEPSTAVIKFPGGYVEVSRRTDGSYWTHIKVDDPKHIVASRIEYTHGAWAEIKAIPKVPRADEITHIAVCIDRQASGQRP